MTNLIKLVFNVPCIMALKDRFPFVSHIRTSRLSLRLFRPFRSTGDTAWGSRGVKPE